ncbi:hypothetical protein ASPSYDRAFT_45718 [Aspergillus sydowii CBS 593.65]|uniref:Uncharacterized protein n=1 Tax=Aspergillus sydowii CBS 593.65 TaxID=1036612 RepID=A0A1L9TIM2_9EURO|nr:uncharacterized protein ASPSYDRAFT_45718 [Aspergillus sydowii CBS 593.65]OJJ59278.1 hypothetical protein ASPSYDRAFT_45718 [Aspergillus sydowii CBS 593.65]
MKLTAALSLGLFASSSLAVSVTQIMKGGGTNDLEIQTDGTCIDLFQGTYGARLNGGVTGTNCRFWVDSGCTGPVIGTISTENPEVEMPDGANGIRCSVPGSD